MPTRNTRVFCGKPSLPPPENKAFESCLESILHTASWRKEQVGILEAIWSALQSFKVAMDAFTTWFYKLRKRMDPESVVKHVYPCGNGSKLFILKF